MALCTDTAPPGVFVKNPSHKKCSYVNFDDRFEFSDLENTPNHRFEQIKKILWDGGK